MTGHDLVSDKKLVVMYRHTRGVLKILEEELVARRLIATGELVTEKKAGLLFASV